MWTPSATGRMYGLVTVLGPVDVEEAALVEAPSAGILDVTLSPGKTDADLRQTTALWEREAGRPDQHQPDIWRPFWIRGLGALETDLRAVQEREMAVIARAFATPEHAEAVRAFIEKRPPEFPPRAPLP